MKDFLLRLAPGLILLLFLISCASVSVQEESSRTTLVKPDKIYIALFAASSGDFQVDRDGAELAAFKEGLQAMLQAAMVTDLNHRLIMAVPDNNQPPPPQENAWIIRGAFVRVNQGSRLLRGAIGFGAGGTKMVTQVSVYNLKSPQTPILTFNTTGGSGAEPGAISGLDVDPVTMAVEIAAGGAGGIAHGLTEDTKRTAREITAELSDYLYQKNLISRDLWIKPKLLDK